MVALPVLAVFALASICTAFEYKPVFYPGPCPEVPPSAYFQQRALVNCWYATHFSNPSFAGIRCATNNITERQNGVQFNSRFLNASGHEETYVSELNATNTPGVYHVSYTTPNGTVSGKQVFYFYHSNETHDTHESHESSEESHDGHKHKRHTYVFTWACINKPEKNMHVECAGIQSKSETSPLSAVKEFQRHLKSHGSQVEEFHEINNKNCSSSFNQ